MQLSLHHRQGLCVILCACVSFCVHRNTHFKRHLLQQHLRHDVIGAGPHDLGACPHVLPSEGGVCARVGLNLSHSFQSHMFILKLGKFPLMRRTSVPRVSPIWTTCARAGRVKESFGARLYVEYIRTYTHTHMHTYTYTHMHTHIHTYMHLSNTIEFVAHAQRYAPANLQRTCWSKININCLYWVRVRGV